MKPCPDFLLALPVYDAQDALRIVTALESAINQIWEMYGEELGQLMVDRASAQGDDRDPDQYDFPF